MTIQYNLIKNRLAGLAEAEWPDAPEGWHAYNMGANLVLANHEQEETRIVANFDQAKDAIAGYGNRVARPLAAATEAEPMTEIKKVPASLLKVGDRIGYRGHQLANCPNCERWSWLTSTITRIESANSRDSIRIYVCTGNDQYMLTHANDFFTLANDEPTTIDDLMPQMPQKVDRDGRRSVD
jgi:hypothetical protein